MQPSSSPRGCLRILHLEDDPHDAELFRLGLAALDRPHSIHLARTEDEFKAALEKGEFDLIVSDSGVLGCDTLEILELVRARLPRTPLVVFSGNTSPRLKAQALERGALEVVSKDDLPQMLATIQDFIPDKTSIGSN